MNAIGLTLSTLLAAALTQQAGTAWEAVDFYSLFKNNVYAQSGNARPAVPSGAFFAASLSSGGPGQVGAARVTDGGPNSLLNLTRSGSSFHYSASFDTTAQMDAAFPFGIPYDFAISGGTLGTQTGSVIPPRLPLYSTVPFLTGASYSRLQGLDASTDCTVTFDGFAPVTGATDSFIFLTIARASDNVIVFNRGFLPPSTDSAFVAADTLAAGTAYVIELDYSSRVITPYTGFGTASSLVGFEQRTQIHFTTAAAAPEPARQGPTGPGVDLTGPGVAAAVLALLILLALRARRRK